jgi:hypothetical protein
MRVFTFFTTGSKDPLADEESKSGVQSNLEEEEGLGGSLGLEEEEEEASEEEEERIVVAVAVAMVVVVAVFFGFVRVPSMEETFFGFVGFGVPETKAEGEVGDFFAFFVSDEG